MKRLISYYGILNSPLSMKFARPRYSRVFNFAEEAGHGNVSATVKLDNPKSTLPKSELPPDKKESENIKENISGTQGSFVPNEKDKKTPNIPNTIDSLNKQTDNQEKINKENSSLLNDATEAIKDNEDAIKRQLGNSNFRVNKTANLWR